MEILKQNDSRWANKQLGTCAGITIGSDGCAIVCAAILGHTTPDVINDYLKNNRGYVQGCVLVWDKVPLEKGGSIAIALTNMYGAWDHFVLVTKQGMSQCECIDPWMGRIVILNTNQLKEYHYYKEKGGTMSDRTLFFKTEKDLDVYKCDHITDSKEVDWNKLTSAPFETYLYGNYMLVHIPTPEMMDFFKFDWEVKDNLVSQTEINKPNEEIEKWKRMYENKNSDYVTASNALIECQDKLIECKNSKGLDKYTSWELLMAFGRKLKSLFERN